jgi:hypothetical protein
MSVTELIHFDKNGEVVPDSPFRRVFLALVILLIATLSFGVGRLTGRGESEGIKIEYDPELSSLMDARSEPPEAQSAGAINSIGPSSKTAGEIVASKNGSKYHYSYCPGAKQIKEENKISFNSSKEAEAAGYTIASNCKPR